MTTGRIRRAQLVTPFGPGALSVLVNGTSVITAGLDHWYDVDSNTTLQVDEYTEHDWRLEARLKVSAFRLPPDYRPAQKGSTQTNTKLTVPALRFPRWCFCMYCKRLKASTLTMRDAETCPDEKHSEQKYKPRMSQVPFVTICSDGHLDDFPFDKWVHETQNPRCNGPLRLTSRGGGGLEGQVVTCDKCGRGRSLQGITNASRTKQGEETTTLSERLSPEEGPFMCTGARPWLAELEGDCLQPMRGALRAAGNVYFPKVESSIYLPVSEGAVSAEMHDLLRRPDVGPVMKALHRLYGPATTAEHIRELVPAELFEPISDEELVAGYRDLFGIDQLESATSESQDDTETLTSNDEWRYPEYERIRETPKDDFLTATEPGVHEDLHRHFGRVRSVDILRETRVLRGFSRVRDDVLKLSKGKALLRRKPLTPITDWLPAYVVKGEGVYLELDKSRLSEWESRAEVQGRAGRITKQYGLVASQRGLQSRAISPRFVLLHTLGHLLINELVFTCGYSSASLRERLYVSNTPGKLMAGLLIYTAAGDSEGTMGGLVRMSRSENLRSVVRSALTDSRWCSTDPVCMDSGEKGQGPDSCNLAACHGCALLPETSCEEFNRFLDRGLVVGTFSDPDLGYFSDLPFV